MFKLDLDQRLDFWLNFRRTFDNTKDPLQEVSNLWVSAPFIPKNHKIDPFNSQSWPTPWEIVSENRYDDFTRALMIGWTLKLSKKYCDSNIIIKTYIDKERQREYNMVCIDDIWVLNYSDHGPVGIESIPESFRLENLIELQAPR
jgi:hypothetical protein